MCGGIYLNLPRIFILNDRGDVLVILVEEFFRKLELLSASVARKLIKY